MQTIRQFEIIQALATHRHFGRAARALRISQPSLTRSLKELESRLGVALFDRNGVEPTVFGEMALRSGEPVLANAAELRREIERELENSEEGRSHNELWLVDAPKSV